VRAVIGGDQEFGSTTERIEDHEPHDTTRGNRDGVILVSGMNLAEVAISHFADKVFEKRRSGCRASGVEETWANVSIRTSECFLEEADPWEIQRRDSG
jgi:hypothetical protein